MIQVKLPSGKIVPVNTDDPKVAAATARAFVQRDPYESTVAAAAKHPALSAVSGAAQTAIQHLPFAGEAQAALTAGLHMSPGDSFGDRWKAARAQQQALTDISAAKHPISSYLVGGLADVAPAAAALVTGGATEAPAIANATGKGLAGFLKPAAVNTGKRAAAGGVAGAVYGAAQPGTVQERIVNAEKGAGMGAGAAAVLAPAVGLAAKATGKAATAVGNTLVRATNKAAGGTLLDASETATKRLAESLRKDGATPELIKDAMNGFLKNGATDPTLMDVASRLPSGGANTLSLIRGAAAKGSGRGVASTYADQVTADLQDKAIARTRKLTPDSRPADVVRAEAVDARGKQADAEYGAIRDTPVDAAPVLSAMEGNTGRAAISGAYKAADARRLGPQMEELDRLRTAAGPEEAPVASIGGTVIPNNPGLAAALKAAQGGVDEVPVSLGTLHRIKVAMAEMGDAAMRGENPSVGGGAFDRAKEIDNHLADTNGAYSIARDNFAKNSADIEALDHGKTGVTAVPDEYAANLHDFLTKGGPDAGKMAAIGYRQSLVDKLGAPTEGATGALNRTSTSTNQGRNLAETFGQEHADAYRAGLKDLVDQLQNARSINPNTASPTAMRLADMGLVDPKTVAPKISPLHIVLGAIDKLRAGATLTDEERAVITRMGTTAPDLSAVNYGDHLRLPPPAGAQLARDLVLGESAADQDQRRPYSQ